ncbi:hypothetical protein HII31_05986 [Pseudocercospora fuligena]|uniref:Uncharacterized protein n=1 Tax=Pseudocercospora fuligena TaxID=685502 RepID=A0A8H6RJI9_9PEZI|nr:hypothetical protein HII31_05986 [Pseudocercospora fuligena]
MDDTFYSSGEEAYFSHSEDEEMEDIFDSAAPDGNVNSASNIHYKKETSAKLNSLARVSQPDAGNMEATERVPTVEEPDSFKLLRAYRAKLNEFIDKGGEPSAVYGTVRTICKNCRAGKCPKHADSKDRSHRQNSKYFKNLQRRPAKLSKEQNLARQQVRVAQAALRDARRAESGPPPLHPILTHDAAKDEELERIYEQKLAKWNLWHDVMSGRKKLD